ncbi:hypothetical protein [Hymenobacter cellulosivorans]|uniref:Uncharacterized protein n=1 Tax=Hymenobacter cellulosivorans TaxID=2932249 RepID=A0ABY4FAD8_9BACT|nr:hypothetical protein [Hymenobacter cellulosivorans]UOQ52889.1 hypothetical protein MUN80_24495 [Hymenobacter cellulosivorans]
MDKEVAAQRIVQEILTEFRLNSKGESEAKIYTSQGEMPKEEMLYAYIKSLDLGFSPTEESSKQQISVDINIPQEYIDTVFLEEILSSTERFMDACGFEYKAEEKPVYGSFFQRLFFWTKSPKTQQEVQEVYAKGKAALEANYLGKPVAEATSQLSTAAAQLIAACQNVDEIVLRTGAIILVKTKKPGIELS